MPSKVSVSKDPARPHSPCFASNTAIDTAMETFSELANLSADVVAKVEDTEEARPAMANATVFRS